MAETPHTGAVFVRLVFLEETSSVSVKQLQVEQTICLIDVTGEAGDSCKGRSLYTLIWHTFTCESNFMLTLHLLFLRQIKQSHDDLNVIWWKSHHDADTSAGRDMLG